MAGLSEIFDETLVVVPEYATPRKKGEMPFFGHNISIFPVKPIMAENLKRKFIFPIWFLRNIFTFYRLIRKADAVHVPVPTDMGTIAMVMANFMKKKLFVRHCGNWFVQVTRAEVFWKNFMEKNAGGRNMFLTTGGSALPPSDKNENIKWIFSTTLRELEISGLIKSVPEINSKAPRLIIVCRQIKEKGTEIVIDALNELKTEFPDIHLDVVGDGGYLPFLKDKAKSMNLEKNITFHDKADHDKVLKLLKASNIFTFPTSASEGFPKALLEAMASGLVAIASPVSVIPDLFSNNGGILLKDYSPATLANAIRTAVKNPDDSRKMQLQAQTNAKNYTLENWSKTIEGYLKESWGEETRSAV